MCLAMAVSVWDKQISLLRDLVNKLRSAISGEQIPVVSQQQEQLKTTIKFLEVTKEARLEVRKELGVVLKQLRTSYENVSFPAEPGALCRQGGDGELSSDYPIRLYNSSRASLKAARNRQQHRHRHRRQQRRSWRQ